MSTNPLAATCDRCFDSGIWLAPTGRVATCPRIQMSFKHVEPPTAAQFLRRRCERAIENQIELASQVFLLGQMLVSFSTDQPAPRALLIDRLFAGTNMSAEQKLRKFHHFIETLRTVWLLPVGSRKSTPCGYWIITDLEDYKAWVSRTMSAPITQLSTIHRNAKANFPVYAEQLELQFFANVERADVG